MAAPSRQTQPKPSSKTQDSEFVLLADILGVKKRRKSAREALEEAKKRK
jgi:hypothetical protein